MTFNPVNQNLDIAWLLRNGWTVPGNLAYRHILHDFIETKVISQERIEQIIMQYNAMDQTEKIKEALRELIALTSEINHL